MQPAAFIGLCRVPPPPPLLPLTGQRQPLRPAMLPGPALPPQPAPRNRASPPPARDAAPAHSVIPSRVACQLPPAQHTTRHTLARFNHMPPAALLRLSRSLCSSVSTMSGFFAEVLGQNGAYKFFLENEWRESASGKRLDIICPSTNAPVYAVQGEEAQGRRPWATRFWASRGACKRPLRAPEVHCGWLGLPECRIALGGGARPAAGGGRRPLWEVAWADVTKRRG